MRNEHENPHRGKPDELRDKAVRLLTYLKEVCQLRFVVVRDCRNYDQLLWFHDIPREPECFCIAWNGPTEANESWIEVRRSLELIRNAADALDFSDAAYKRIDESIRRLEELKKVCTDSKSVWRRAP